MPSKSIRLPKPVLDELEKLRGARSFTDVCVDALQFWIERKRRELEDSLIADALTHRSAEQRAEEAEIVEAASEASARAIAALDHDAGSATH